MDQAIHERFLHKLEEKYGTWSKPTAKFGNTSYGEIATELSISASQFSKLIYGTATEGMYIRSIENINRLLTRETIREERDTALEMLQKVKRQYRRRQLIFCLLLGLLAAAMGVFFYLADDLKNNSLANFHSHPLIKYFDQNFDAAFDSPYLRESEVNDYCPCSAFEGEWSLAEPFKLPLPGTRRPGLYYLAKQADLRMKCSNLNAPYVPKGKALAGYEYLISEIWVDTEKEPLIPKYFDLEKKSFTPAFEALNFTEQPRFKRVAVLHAFNVNNFEIYPDSIVRRAELTGRYVTDLDEQLAKTYKIDVKHIVRNVLGNLTKTDCKTAPNPYCNPNHLVEGVSTIAFDCIYTIEAENLGLGGGYPYTKKFRLEKQAYADNVTCGCHTK